MKSTTIRIAGLRGAAVVAAVCGVSFGFARAAYSPGTNLYLGGGLASSRVFQHDGVACVPIADVAKALNQVVTQKADGYLIAPPGGRNPVSGLNGKIGDKLTDGQITITLLKAFRTDKYSTQFKPGHDVTPDANGDDVVVAVFRVKNMLDKPVEILPDHGSDTSLTDQDEHSYKSTYCDVHDIVPKMLPASAADFALCFSVPKSEKVGDLVYEVFTYGATKDSKFRIAAESVNP